MHQDLGYFSLNNQDAFYPRVMQGGGAGILPSEKYLIDVGHLRIKNINLSYNLPKSIANRVWLRYVKFIVSIENLGFVYNKSRLDMDPAQIRNQATYPMQRVYSLGVRLGL